jgi:hypothetical protein
MLPATAMRRLASGSEERIITSANSNPPWYHLQFMQ